MSHEQGLARRRRELVQRSAAQRAALVATVSPLVRRAAIFDRAVASARRYPLAAGLVAGAVALLGGRRLFDIASRAFALYTLFRQSRP